MWHLGEVYSACLAELGNKVIGIDKNPQVVANLNKTIVPLAEPKLQEIVKRNIKNGRLKYTTDFQQLANCNIIWFTTDIPVDKQDRASLNELFALVKKALPHMKNGSLIVVSSQLPAGTFAKLSKFIKANRPDFKFDYAYVPENLRLGEAVDSFMKPSRIVIGTSSDKRRQELTKIFKSLTPNIIPVSIASAEMTKHATNAFLSTSLSFIYDIADICEAVGADVVEVSRGLRADERIGEKAYLDASAGFSGGHLARDLQYLRKIAKSQKIDSPVINSVIRKNQGRRKIIFEKISPYLGPFKDKTVTFFGITYKSGTPTLANSLPLAVAKDALLMGSKIVLCDPWVNPEEIPAEIPEGKYRYFDDPSKSAKSSHVIICITPWEGLKKLDWRKIGSLMTGPKIFFDARNYFVAESRAMEKAGIKYIGVGR